MICRKKAYFLPVLLIAVLASCAPMPQAPEARLDTPQHHARNGDKLLESGRIDAAWYEFNRARELDPQYAPAYAGLGLVEASRGEFENGLKSLKTARWYARGDRQKQAVCVAYMRIYILGGEKIDKDWLVQVEKEFSAAQKSGPDRPAPHYYMGLAYKSALEFGKAAAQLKKVLQLEGAYVAAADREYALMQKIERARPGSEYGKKISVLERITRADVAALLVEELKLDEVFAGRTPEKFDPSAARAQRAPAVGQSVKVTATDIAGHVLKADIETVMETGIKGLQPYPDHTYRPDQTVSRAEFAVMLEDILIKITGSPQLATRFIGSKSPFLDLSDDQPYFNAVMTCTTRGIMTVKDPRTGEFDPLGPISGADALLSIRALKSQH